MTTTPPTTRTGAATGDSFGWSVAGAGDVNGDGDDDVIVGAQWYSASTGRAYVYLGYHCDASDVDRDAWADCEDCDDADAAVFPGAAESDNGFTDPDRTMTACEPPEGYVAAVEDDCDDADPTRHPGSEEFPTTASTRTATAPTPPT